MKPGQHSSQIIDLLAKGEVGKVYELTGNPYRIRGLVIHGNHLGRTLGFPTANLQLPENEPFLPAHGVYAVMVSVNNLVFKGMANAGIRPTINGKTLAIEINLFDFDGDLYGETLEVDFIGRLRDEKKFNSLDELAHQIGLDKVNALKSLA
jgi:riboflavin kinase / FMN adenylyltransferase